MRSHPDTVRLLLKAGADPNVEFRFDGIGDLTPLAFSAHGGDHRTVLALLEYGAEVDAVSEIQRHGTATPLMLAVRQGHEHVAEVLLNKGADPTLVDEEQKTPLERARTLGQARLVALLLAAVDRAEAGAQRLKPARARGYQPR